MRGTASVALPNDGTALAGGVETVPRWVLYDFETLTPGDANFWPLIPRRDTLVSQLVTGCRSVAQTGSTLCRMGLYLVAANGDLTLVARTANDPTLWSATATEYARNLDTAGGYPSSYLLRMGCRYRISAIQVGGTSPQLHAVKAQPNPMGTRDPVPWLFQPGQADLPTAIAAGSSSTYTGGIIWAAAA